MRPGFQGRSKWNRSVQCAWKFSPSRAASVAIRMRSGSSAGCRVEAALDLPAVRARGLAVDGLDPLVGEVGAGDGLLQHLPQIAFRADHVLGKDQHPPVVPARPVGAQVVVDPADQRAGLGVRPSAGGRRHLLHPVEQVLFGAPQRLGIRTLGRHAFGSGVDGRDLSCLFRFVLVVRVLRAIVVGVRGRGEPGCGLGRERIAAGGRDLAIAGREALPLLAGRPAMPRQGNGECLDRRQQLLLQPHHEQSGRGAGARGYVLEPGLPDAAVLVEQPRQHELRRILRQPVDHDPAHVACRETALQFADVLLDAADHDVFQGALAAHRHAAGEAVGVEQFQQRSEAVGVAIVGRSGQEQAVLEAPAEIADGAGELGLDAVASAARRRRVVCFVQDQQAARRQLAQPLAHRIRVGRVDEQIVRHDEAAVGAPRVDPEATLAAHLRQIGAVKNDEQKAEAFLHLRLPLLHYGSGGRDHHRPSSRAQ